MRHVPLIALVALGVIAFTIACSSDDDTNPSPTPTTVEPDATASATPVDSDDTPTPLGTPTLTSGDFEVDEFTIKPKLTRARPGTVTFSVSNTGAVAHEFIVVASDLPAATLPRAADDLGVDESQVEIVGRIDVIAPGDTDEISLDLPSGRYLLICNLVSSTDSHYIKGMYTPFTISDDAPAPASGVSSE